MFRFTYYSNFDTFYYFMIPQDFVRSPQNYFFLASLLGFIGSDIGILVLIFVSRQLFFDYLSTLIIICIMFFCLIIYGILAMTCWHGCFFQHLLKTYLRRFLLFFVIISFHTSILLQGLVCITLIEYFKYLLPGMLIFDDSYEVYYIILLALLLFSIIIFFVGLTIAYKNPSDKEIAESQNQNYYQDYLRDPQKTILCVSLFMLYLFTFLQCGNIAYLYFTNKGDNNYFYIYIISFSIAILLTGSFQVLFIIINSIYACTCWRGKFIQRFFDKPIRRYLFIIYGCNFYHISIYSGCFAHKMLKEFIKNTTFLLIFAIIQLISLIVFLIGLYLVVRNESDKEIINGTNETINEPLISNQ